MTNQVIPAEAVEAAAQALRDAFDWGVTDFDKQARAALEAAAQHIMAQAADIIAEGMQAWAGASERAYVQGFAEAAWGKATK